MAITINAHRAGVITYFIFIIFCVGHLFPEPEIYISYDFAVKICDLLFEEVNADSIYDAYSLIDWVLIMTITLFITFSTMKLITKIRKK